MTTLQPETHLICPTVFSSPYGVTAFSKTYIGGHPSFGQSPEMASSLWRYNITGSFISEGGLPVKRKPKKK